MSVRYPFSLPARRPMAGFTLLELMIVVVIVGLLAAVAYPSYVNYVRKARRAEAMEFVSRIQQAQERYRVNNAQYAYKGTSPGFATVSAALTALGITSVYSSAQQYYEVTDLSGSATTYSITLTGRGTQASDAGCTTMTARINAGQMQYLDADLSSSRCWSR